MAVEACPRYPVNPICDRKTVNFFKGQTGFLGFCVKPLVVELCACAGQDSQHTATTKGDHANHCSQGSLTDQYTRDSTI